MLVPRSCEKSSEYWTIDQTKSQITMELHEATVVTGVKLAVERHKIEKARGPLRKSFARLDGETGVEEIVEGGARRRSPKFPVTYELQYDPQTEHLAGTRNGTPVRFIRADLQEVDRSQCKKVP
jgi:hypothetical protein